MCQFLLGPSEMDTLGVSEHVLGGWGDRKQDTPQLTHPNNQSDIRLWRGQGQIWMEPETGLLMLYCESTTHW